MAEPVKHLYQNHLWLAGAGITDVQRDVPFKILVANFAESQPVSYTHLTLPTILLV